MSTELNSKTYATLLQNLKKEISTARIRAHLSVNKEMINLYWSIGNQILERQKQEGWGSKVIENISKDLRKEFPEMTGLSYQNISYMRQFVIEYDDQEILQQAIGEIPWGHNITIFSKVKNHNERIWYAQKTIGKDPNHITYINAKSGSRLYENIDPYKVVRMSLFQISNKEGMDFLLSISVTAGAISFGCFILIFLLWSKFGRGLKSEKKKDGSGTVLTTDAVRRKLKSLKLASDLTIGKMPLVKDMETRHFLVTGSTGFGKTNWMHNILPQVEKKKQPTIVVDQTGEMIAKYYNKERGDIIFNPFDERSYVWDFWADIVDDESLERFAGILIGFNRKISGTRSDPFWEKSAIEIFESAVRYQKATHDKSIERLNILVRQTELKHLRQKLTGTAAATAAARYLESENSVTANSILSVLTTSTKPLVYLQDITGQNVLCAGHGKEVEDESSLQADLKRSASLDKVILVREWLKEVDGKIRLERTETR